MYDLDPTGWNVLFCNRARRMWYVSHKTGRKFDWFNNEHLYLYDLTSDSDIDMVDWNDITELADKLNLVINRCQDESIRPNERTKYTIHHYNENGKYEFFDLADKYPSAFGFECEWVENTEEDESSYYRNEYTETKYILGKRFQRIDCDGVKHDQFSMYEIMMMFYELALLAR
jgi:hypothetical protein